VWKLNAVTARVVETVRPDVVYVPFPFDLHKDHREIFHSMSVAWRPSTEVGGRIREIYSYETLSETHWNIPYVEGGFLPNTWVDISEYLEKKLEALRCFASQVRQAPDARSVEAVRALAVWRGAQMGMKAAEAFVIVRKIW
jgi:LmbE family N-acetylglucosaminyl deacetylase